VAFGGAMEMVAGLLARRIAARMIPNPRRRVYRVY
jgi:hypothetical protein